MKITCACTTSPTYVTRAENALFNYLPFSALQSIEEVDIYWSPGGEVCVTIKWYDQWTKKVPKEFLDREYGEKIRQILTGGLILAILYSEVTFRKFDEMEIARQTASAFATATQCCKEHKRHSNTIRNLIV